MRRFSLFYRIFTKLKKVGTDVGESNLEQAAKKVSRNPKHLPQVVSLLTKSLGEDQLKELSVEKMVEHWWKNQLFWESTSSKLRDVLKGGNPPFAHLPG